MLNVTAPNTDIGASSMYLSRRPMNGAGVKRRKTQADFKVSFCKTWRCVKFYNENVKGRIHMTDEEKRAEDRFRKIVKLAWRCEPLGKEFTYICDHELYERLANLFTGHRRDKTILKPELEKKGNIFKAAYKTKITNEWLHERVCREDQERYKKLYELRTEIIKSSKEKTNFELLQLFVELFGKVFTDTDAKVLSDNIGNRSDEIMSPIAEESEGIINGLLLSLRTPNKVAVKIFEDVKAKGQGSYNGFVVRPSSKNENKFKLYHAPTGVIKKENT